MEKFLAWCVGERGNSWRTCRDRANYLARPLDPRNGHSVKAYRLFYMFLGRPLPEGFPRPPRSGADLRVPSEEEVLLSVAEACRVDARLCMVYRLLLESGMRRNVVVEVLSGYEESRDKRHGGFYTYYVGRTGGSKQAYHLFHVSPIVPVRISADHVSKLARIHGLVRPKYMRKFAITKMHELGLAHPAVMYIVGHSARDIQAAHYLDRHALALQHYPKYADWLRSFYSGLGLK